MESNLLITCYVEDHYHGLSLGFHTLFLVDVKKNHVVLRQKGGCKFNLPKKLFKFIGVYGYVTRIDKDGNVLIEENGKWTNIGPLFTKRKRAMDNQDLGDI